MTLWLERSSRSRSGSSASRSRSSRRRPRLDRRDRARRILVPFTGGALDPTVLDAAIRIARAEDATLVPAYLIVVPLEYCAEDAPMQRAGRRRRCRCSRRSSTPRCAAGVPVDARIEKRADADARAAAALGRRALRPHRRRRRRPAHGPGFTPKDLDLDAHARAERDADPAARSGPKRLAPH